MRRELMTLRGVSSTTLAQAAAAAETTHIPVDARAGYCGAIAYFAVLRYPGVDLDRTSVVTSSRLRSSITSAECGYPIALGEAVALFRLLALSGVNSPN